jgi:steroid delta-isomerase-like uncharacterized protein
VDAAVNIDDAIRQELEALNRHDVEAVLAFYTDDVVFEDVSLAEPLHGKQAMRTYMADFFVAFPDLHIDERTIFGGRLIAAAEYELSGTHRGTLDGRPPTGRTFRLRALSVYAYDGHLFNRETFYWDSATMLRQLGLV